MGSGGGGYVKRPLHLVKVKGVLGPRSLLIPHFNSCLVSCVIGTFPNTKLILTKFYHVIVPLYTSVFAHLCRDQRMTQDVDKWCDQLTQVLPNIILSPGIIAYYSYKTFQRYIIQTAFYI